MIINILWTAVLLRPGSKNRIHWEVPQGQTSTSKKKLGKREWGWSIQGISRVTNDVRKQKHEKCGLVPEAFAIPSGPLSRQASFSVRAPETETAASRVRERAWRKSADVEAEVRRCKQIMVKHMKIRYHIIDVINTPRLGRELRS